MLVVLDRDYRIAGAPPGLNDFLERSGWVCGTDESARLPSALEQTVRDATSSWCGLDCDSDRSAVVPVNADLAVRVALMRGPDGICYALTFERIAYRENLLNVKARFNLSRRQADILAHLIRGLNAGEIAAKLSISQNTVREHVKHIYEKCGVSSRGELVARALNWTDLD